MTNSSPIPDTASLSYSYFPSLTNFYIIQSRNQGPFSQKREDPGKEFDYHLGWPKLPVGVGGSYLQERDKKLCRVCARSPHRLLLLFNFHSYNKRQHRRKLVECSNLILVRKVRYEERMLVRTKATLSRATDFIFQKRKLVMIPIVSSFSDLVFKFLRCQNENSRHRLFSLQETRLVKSASFFRSTNS